MSKAENFPSSANGFQRVEGFDKVTGDSEYIADIYLPGMLVGKVLRSPFPHARIRHIDTSKAEKACRRARRSSPPKDTIKRPWGAFFADQYILSVGKTRYVGEEVAAVAAIDTDTAEEAIDLIEVDWEPLPAVFDAEEAMKDGAALVHDDKPNNIAMHLDLERGNVAQAFAESDVIVEDTFTSMPQWHCSIETIGSVAEYATSGKYTVYMNTQTLFNARYRIATALGVPETDGADHSERGRRRLRRQILRRQQRSGRRGSGEESAQAGQVDQHPRRRISRRLPAARLHEDKRQDGLQKRRAAFAPRI
jgi:CO/xanthine dehydrogenase Mo-binding subunit